MTSPQIRVTRKITRKKKKQIWAASAAPVAIPPNPKTAAMIAMMKNAADHVNMRHLHSNQERLQGRHTSCQSRPRANQMRQDEAPTTRRQDPEKDLLLDETPRFGLPVPDDLPVGAVQPRGRLDD